MLHQFYQNLAMFLLAPDVLLALATFTVVLLLATWAFVLLLAACVFVLLVTEVMVDEGSVFSLAKNMFRRSFPPQIVVLSPVQGILHSVLSSAHSPGMELPHQHWLPSCTPVTLYSWR